MAKVTHPLLGTIEPSAPGYWEVDLPFGGRELTLDLTIEESGLPASALQELPQSVTDLEPLDRAARAAILADARSGDEDAASVMYLTHHQDVLEPEEYQRAFGVSAPDLADPEPLLSRLALVRVGLYPEEDERRILLDYSIDPDTTNYLLCVSFDEDGEVVAVDLES
jgi:hypothetical protein